MNAEPRTIAFLCELRHPPLAADPAPLQRLHNRMFESGTPTYPSFQVTEGGAVLSRPVAQAGGSSSVTFLTDRIVFQEELSGLTVDEFAARVQEVCGQAAELRSIQVIVAQIVTVRTLANPRRFRDSKSFLKDGVFGFGDELERFEREPQLFGLRLVFPPTPAEPNAYNLRIESFAQDPRSLFLENQGSFGPAVGPQGLEQLARNVRATYDFVVERALAFLGPFDAHQEA